MFRAASLEVHSSQGLAAQLHCPTRSLWGKALQAGVVAWRMAFVDWSQLAQQPWFAITARDWLEPTPLLWIRRQVLCRAILYEGDRGGTPLGKAKEQQLHRTVVVAMLSAIPYGFAALGMVVRSCPFSGHVCRMMRLSIHVC